MSEKKTFKNQRVQWSYEPLMRKYGWTVEGIPIFFADEWDMEVTFTKKEKPLAVGDVIKYDNYNGSKTATIMAIDDDQCWLKFSDGSHATWELDEVYR